MPKAVAWIVRCVGDEEFRKTIEDFRPEGEPGDMPGLDLAFPVAVHWLLAGLRDDEGQTLGELWEKAGWPGAQQRRANHEQVSLPVICDAA